MKNPKIPLPAGKVEVTSKFVNRDSKPTVVELDKNGVPWLFFEESDSVPEIRNFRVVESKDDLSESKEYGTYICDFVSKRGVRYCVFEYFES